MFICLAYRVKSQSQVDSDSVALESKVLRDSVSTLFPFLFDDDDCLLPLCLPLGEPLCDVHAVGVIVRRRCEGVGCQDLALGSNRYVSPSPYY